MRAVTRKLGASAANVVVLVLGTIAGHLVTLAATPVLSRYFEPAAFGTFGVFSGLVAVVGSVATLRYEVAVVLPKSDERARELLFASVLVAIGLSALVAMGLWIGGGWIGRFLDVPSLDGWWWALPLGVLAMGMTQALASWFSRRQDYRIIAGNQLLRSTATVVSQIVGGAFGLGSVVLVGGKAIGDIAGAARLAWVAWKQGTLRWLENGTFRRAARAAKEFPEFPTYSSAQALLNALSQNIPVVLVASYYGVHSAGLFAFSHRILSLPVGVLSQSVRQVYVQRFSQNEVGDPRNRATIIRATLLLAVVGVVPAVLLSVWSEPMFALCFGEEWRQAGTFARALLPWLVALGMNPVSMSFLQAFRFQRLLLAYDVGLLLARVIVLVLASRVYSDVGAIFAFSIVGFGANLFLIVVAGVLARAPRVLSYDG